MIDALSGELEVNDDVTIEQAVSDAIGECAGYVSLCWNPRPTGVFDSALASAAVQNAVGRAHSAMQEERAAGYLSGLDAAREAVAGMVIKTAGNSAATVDQALAAIDALSQKP